MGGQKIVYGKRVCKECGAREEEGAAFYAGMGTRCAECFKKRVILKALMRMLSQRNSKWTRCLWLVLLLSVLMVMTAAAAHVHKDNAVAHDHCSLCQMASEMVAVCAVILALLLLDEISHTVFCEPSITLALWKPSVPRVRPPPIFLFV